MLACYEDREIAIKSIFEYAWIFLRYTSPRCPAPRLRALFNTNYILCRFYSSVILLVSRLCDSVRKKFNYCN